MISCESFDAKKLTNIITFILVKTTMTLLLEFKKMNKTLRIALCGLNSEELEQVKKEKEERELPAEQQTITMSGPLGEVYTKALAVLFAKKNPVTEEVTMESQANDAIMALIAAKSAANIDNHLGEGVASLSKQIESNVLTTSYDKSVNAYVVDPDDFTPEDIATAYVNKKIPTKSIPADNYFVIDYNNADSNYGLDNIPLSFNLQQHCDAFGMKLIFGMENFVKAISATKVVSK